MPLRDKEQSSPPGAPGSDKFMRMSSADYLKNYEALHAGVAARTDKPKGVSASWTAPAGAPKKKRKTEEDDLHRMCFEWIFALEAQYPILEYTMHVPNGGARSKGEAGKMKAMGVRSGVVDITNPFPYGGFNGFACELKSSTGRLSDSQLKYLAKCKSQGWLTGLARTLDEFIALKERYLGMTPSIERR